MEILKDLKNFKHALLDFLFPISCVCCKKEKTHCCHECLQKITSSRPRVLTVPKEAPALDRLIAAAEFQERSPLAELIHRFKYDGAQEIGGILVSLFPSFLLAEIKNSMLIPVPLHTRRLRFRGFNQSAILARALAETSGATVKNTLVRMRFTQPQVTLKREERLRNVHNAFSLKKEIRLDPDMSYVLVDDVCTTGATLNECAAVLKRHGARRVIGIVIGRAI